MNLTAFLPSAAAWRRLAPFLVLLAAVLLLFRGTVVAMVSIWDRSETFAHAFLVPPIVVWLAWRRRATLATLPTRPAWSALPLMAAALVLWQLGELAGVNAATQLAVVALVVLCVPAVYGWTLARALTFPLLFLFFCVPIGEFMVPYMVGWTADFAAAAIRLSGVPIYREGTQFVIPTGNWSVVEACSGVRYLIASLMVGTLFAYLNFQSSLKRALFMVASLLVPIGANWVRAYLIVMLGHLSGNKLAAGVDHIIYGWVFFGIVIGLMFVIGARWAEPDLPEPPPEGGVAGAAPAAMRAVLPRAVLGVGLGTLVLLGAAQAFDWQLQRPHTGPLPALALPTELAAVGSGAGPAWVEAPAPVTTWVPAFANAALNSARSYQSGDAQAGVWVAYYRDQGYDRKMVTSSNNLVDLEVKAEWAQTAADAVVAPLPGGALALRAGDLRGSAVPGVAAAQRLRVWQVYWVGGHWTNSDTMARVQLALNRLAGRGDDAATLFFYAPIPSQDASSAAADAVLSRFVPAALPAVESLLKSAP